MKTVHARVSTCAALLLSCLSIPVFADVQLVPVVSSGIASPTFVGNAGDGTNRLFIVERAGTIRVLQPGSASPTLFLDIRSKSCQAASRACWAWRSIRCMRPTAASSSTTRKLRTARS